MKPGFRAVCEAEYRSGRGDRAEKAGGENSKRWLLCGGQGGFSATGLEVRVRLLANQYFCLELSGEVEQFDDDGECPIR